jgi:hypothetical protein
LSAFKRRSSWAKSDHIVEVTNGKRTGWIKPSNIQRNLVAKKGDPKYKRARQAVHSAFAQFMDTVYREMSDAERQALPEASSALVNAIVFYALKRLPEFGELLTETVMRVYAESPVGERFIQDPERSTTVSDAVLFLDNDGNLVSVSDPNIVRAAVPQGLGDLELKSYGSYRVLTGPLAGKRFSGHSRPLGKPVCQPGLATSPVSASSSASPASALVKPAPGGVFISYSHKDKKWLNRLQVHLKPLERLGVVTRWDDTLIQPGSNWRDEIKKAIKSARVAVLLISADFLASDFIANDELPPLLNAAKARGTIVLPVMVSPSLVPDSLSQFQAVNPLSRPMNAMSKADQEALLVKIVKAIEARLRSPV